MAPHLSFPIALVYIIILLIPLLTLRLLAILPPNRPPPAKRKRGTPTRLLIVLGSGGHTAEMLAMLRNAEASGLRWKDYTHRTWVVSSGDSVSADRAKGFETEVAANCSGSRVKDHALGISLMDSPEKPRAGEDVVGSYDIAILPRARRIHQSLLTTPISALYCLYHCFRILSSLPASQYPDLILANGPATATILILASLILRFFDIRGASKRGTMRTVYVESWARVNRLSLSGKLLVRVVDRFLVQWPGLEGVGGRGEFLGVLV
ncbi:UDP-N-acetylglucosamine transferase subunit [Elasticomyces elasticus]|nr:UDP-N-acetylglucosamine transferase subunit [Elasticomyces elasticus]